MRVKKSLLGGGLVAVALASACVMGMTGTALAASSTWPVPTAPKANTVTINGTVKTVVTASANGCYRTFPEILGLSNPLANTGAGANYTDATEALTAMQTDPDYGLYGSPANNEPDAYMWNYYYNFYAAANNLDKADPTVTSITCNDGAAGINQTAVAAYGGVCAAFYHRPDIAYGQGTIDSSTGDATKYAEYVKLINGFTSSDEWYHAGDETYDPQLIDCRGTYGQKLFHIDTLYDLAKAAQTTIDKSNGTKTTRYGDDPYEYAVEFEKLVRGTNYAVMKAIDEKRVTKKTVAYVTNVDTDTNQINTIATDPTSTSFEDMYQGIWGGTCIRYMYGPNILECVTNNIGDVDNLDTNEKGLYIATAKDLMKCDCLMLRTGNGMGDCTADADKIKEILRAAGYTDESKWPDMFYSYPTFPGGGGGNYAYVSYYASMMSFVYPEVISPSDLDAYYCQTVYHVSSTYLDDAMNILFAKASLPSGYSIDLSKYSYDTVSNTLNAGMRWYTRNKESVDTNYPTMKMTDYLAENIKTYDTISLAGAVVTLAKTSYTYAGKAITPAVTVKVNGNTLTPAADYKVSYSNNNKAGKATVTVTGIDNYSGTATATFTIAKGKQTIKASNKTVKRGKSVKLGAKAAGKLTYSVNAKAKKAGISVSKAGKVTAKKKAKKGTYKITIKAAATAGYNAASKVIKVKVK